jgi:hypothetical protein
MNALRLRRRYQKGERGGRMGRVWSGLLIILFFSNPVPGCCGVCRKGSEWLIRKFWACQCCGHPPELSTCGRGLSPSPPKRQTDHAPSHPSHPRTAPLVRVYCFGPSPPYGCTESTPQGLARTRVAERNSRQERGRGGGKGSGVRRGRIRPGRQPHFQLIVDEIGVPARRVAMLACVVHTHCRDGGDLPQLEQSSASDPVPGQAGRGNAAAVNSEMHGRRLVRETDRRGAEV